MLVCLLPHPSYLFFLQYICIMFHKLFLHYYSYFYKITLWFMWTVLYRWTISKIRYGREYKEVSQVNHILGFSLSWGFISHPTGSRPGQLKWSTRRHSAFISLSCKAIVYSCMLHSVSPPFLFKLCVLSRGSGVSPSSPFYPDLIVHESQWFLSLECSAGWELQAVSVTWALKIMPFLPASSSLNQAQPDCINQELGCFQVSCIFSFLIFKNYFSSVQWISKRKVGPNASTLPSHWRPWCSQRMMLDPFLQKLDFINNMIWWKMISWKHGSWLNANRVSDNKVWEFPVCSNQCHFHIWQTVPEGPSTGVSWGFYHTFLPHLQTRHVTTLENPSHCSISLTKWCLGRVSKSVSLLNLIAVYEFFRISNEFK